MNTSLKVGAGDTATLLKKRHDSLREELLRTEVAAAPVPHDFEDQDGLTRNEALQLQAVAASSVERLRMELRKTEAAQDRDAKGNYGECCRCGDEIDAARLEHDPATPFCEDCVKG